MKYAVFIFWMCCLSLFATGQSNQIRQITLDQLIDSALTAFQLTAQRQIVDETYQLKLHNLRTNFLPVAVINAQASYQSEVTVLKIPLPGVNVPEMAKDWYKINLDLSQTMYDGGYNKAMRSVEEHDRLLSANEVKQAEDGLKKQVTDLYFNVLLIDQQSSVLRLMLESMEGVLGEMASRVNAGMLLKSERDAVLSESLRYRQQLVELESSRRAMIAMLSELCRFPLNASDNLQLPAVSFSKEYVNERPELHHFNLSGNRMEGLKALEKVKKRPVVAAFGQAGYGRPGYNMLDDSFNDYYMAGIRLSYKPWDWNNSRRNLRLIGLKQESIELARENFNSQHQASWLAQMEELEKYDTLIQLDEQIVKLQQSVVENILSQLNHGAITGSVYLTELNKQTRALIDVEIHQIKQLRTKVDIMYLTGKY